MSTYTYKLLGAVLGVVAGTALLIVGAVLENDALIGAGSGLTGSAVTAIYTNGRKGTDQP